MSWMEAIILAIVEGVTEFFPISSTGHLILASHFMNMDSTEANKAFNIFIQLGAVLAVMVREREILMRPATLRLLLASFIPTGIIGFLGKKYLEAFLDNVHIVAWSLVVGGVLFLFLEKLFLKKDKSIEDLTIKDCVVIGLVQSLALIPGVSRSASALVGALGVGLNRSEASRYAFLLAVPTLGAASLYKAKDVFQNFDGSQISVLLVSLLLCFVISYFAMNLCIGIVKRMGLFPFGIYRIIAGAVVLWILSGHL